MKRKGTLTWRTPNRNHNPPRAKKSSSPGRCIKPCTALPGGFTQAQIADQLGISHATVNRLIKRGPSLASSRSRSTSPVEPLWKSKTTAGARGIRRGVVVPTVSDNPQIALQSVGEAAARLMPNRSPTETPSALPAARGERPCVAGLQPSRRFDIEVIPATGSFKASTNRRQPRATLMADRLGGHSFQIHAPLFADSERNGKCCSHGSVADVFKRAAEAKIARGRIGSILSARLQLLRPAPLLQHRSRSDRAIRRLLRTAAHLLDDCGRVCATGLNRRLFR
ncbi:sugar-binding transcriptional regulator (plasmid) [Sinorhizobium meliloti]|nr:sugar-binding transcriptional regulator [Sinorhizobium meliloti]